MTTTTPIGFHRVHSGDLTSFTKGHIYFYYDLHKIYLAAGTTIDDLEEFTSNVKNVAYSPSAKKLTITDMSGNTNQYDLSELTSAVEESIGNLSSLETTAKTDLVSAINEVLAAVDAGGTGSVVTMETEIFPPQEEGGFLMAYTIKQGDVTVGTINIPRDMVVSSGTVETNPSGQPTGTYLVLTLANATSDKVYINVGKLVDLYTAKQAATQVQLSINSVTREISATIVAGSIGTTELASKCVTGAKLADGAVNTSHIANGAVSAAKLEPALQLKISGTIQASDITTGTANGTISVDGTDVPVKGLGTAAYANIADFAKPSDLTDTLNAAKEYSNGLHNWLTWEEA